MIRRLRQTRTSRLAPVQRLVQAVEELVRWLGDKLALEAKPQVQQTGEMTEQPSQTETVKSSPTIKEALQKHAHRPLTKHQPGGHSRGVRV